MSSKMELLNEKGLELLELKKALETKNELVRNPLKESVKAMKLKNTLKLSLLDDSTTAQFIERLLKEKAYVNQEKKHELYGQYTELLERDLKKQKIMVQFDTDVKEGIEVVKRFGAQEEFAKRYFKMTDKEFDALKESGFVDTFMKTLALSMKRDFDEKIARYEKKVQPYYKGTLKTKVGNVYLDEETGYYNVDIRILLLDYEVLNKPNMRFDISNNIKSILESLQGSHFKRMTLNG